MEYKNLNINRDRLDAQIDSFIKTNDFELIGNTVVPAGKRVVFKKPDEPQATVDLLFTNTGTTTVHYKMGKNQPLGIQLATYLFEQIQENEVQTVSFSISGVSKSDIESVIEELSSEAQSTGELEFQINAVTNQTGTIYSIASVRHLDKLTITHYPSTNRLLIQGRPLHCYGKFIYFLSVLLSLEGLTSVIHRKDLDETNKIVAIPTSENEVQVKLPDAYIKLPEKIKRLLISGNCIKAAKPELLDYSLLLYTDLRSLEGVLRSTLHSYGLAVSQCSSGFGTIFDAQNNMEQKYHPNISCGQKMIDTLEAGYSFYRKHRHRLFHMDDMPDTSRVVDTLDKALSLCDDTYQHINDLYKFRSKI